MSMCMRELEDAISVLVLRFIGRLVVNGTIPSRLFGMTTDSNDAEGYDKALHVCFLLII